MTAERTLGWALSRVELRKAPNSGAAILTGSHTILVGAGRVGGSKPVPIRVVWRDEAWPDASRNLPDFARAARRII